MKPHSKRYQAAEKLYDRTKSYDLKEALSVLGKFPKAKYNETVEMSFSLSIDPKKSDQMVRGTVTLPHGIGKAVRIAVFCKGEQEQVAREAGADIVGSVELIEKVAKGFLDFDRAIATPDMMGQLSKLGKVLGPRGLMPSPKTGSVTNNIAQAVKEAKAGKIEFKSDKQGDIHAGVGKLSFSEEQLYENATTLVQAIKAVKPASVKGELIKNASVSSTLSPGIKVLV